jgi:hypothetical protein
VRYRKRIGSSKFRPIKDTFQYLITGVRIVMYFRPLRVFLPLSFALFSVALVKGLYDFWYSPLGLTDSDILISLVAVSVLSVGMLGDLVVAQRRGE